MKFRYTSRYPARAYPATAKYWSWATAALLLGLLMVARSVQAQSAASIAAGTTLYQNGDAYSAGTLQNAGTYVPASGTLLITSGDFINTGTISTGPATATVKLLESNAAVAHAVALGGQALPNLTLDVPAGTTLSTNGTVNGAVTLLNGHLLTSPSSSADYILTLGAAATLVGETNAHYVKGRVAQARSLSGSTAVDYGNMGLTLNPNGGSFTLAAERRAGLTRSGVSYGTNPAMTSFKGIDRVWALSSATTTLATPATLTLSWLSADDNGLTFSGTNAQVWRSDNGGSTWTQQGTVQNGSGRSVSVPITKPNALYTVSSTAAPLPVTLVAFAGTKQGPDGLLTWRTASEVNSAYFELQSGTDGRTWQALNKQAAAGTSTSTRDYRYLDRTLARYGASVVYYRLRQVDVDGSEHFSPIVALAVDAPGWEVTAYPNPFEADLTAQLTTSEAGPVSVTMLDAAGHVVRRRTIVATPGTQLISLAEDGPPLATGAYLLVVRQNGHAATVRVVRH